MLQWHLEGGGPHLPLRLRSLLQNLVQFFHGLCYEPVSSGKSLKGRCSSVHWTDFSSSCICICCVTGKWLKVNCYSRILCSFSLLLILGTGWGKKTPHTWNLLQMSRWLLKTRVCLKRKQKTKRKTNKKPNTKTTKQTKPRTNKWKRKKQSKGTFPL